MPSGGEFAVQCCYRRGAATASEGYGTCCSGPVRLLDRPFALVALVRVQLQRPDSACSFSKGEPKRLQDAQPWVTHAAACSTADRRSIRLAKRQSCSDTPTRRRSEHPKLRALTLCVALRRRMRCLAVLATAKMASCLFPPNLSDGPTNLPLAEDIEKNPTVFGELLRGEAPIRKVHECDTYLAFRNVKNYAPLAGLVIPKRRRPQDPDGLGKADVSLLEDMRRIALEVCQREQPEAFAKKDYWLRFHRRPWHSVDHLHLHVLAPA